MTEDGASDEGSNDASKDASIDSTVPGTDGSTTPPGDAGLDITPPLDIHIVIDQFGYRPAAEKIAVVRNPQQGFDVDSSYAVGSKYALVDATSGQKLLEGPALPWNGGATDPSSGDHAWWFDFSSVTTPGSYYILDESSSVRSATFQIGDGVYKDALVQAQRVFYYQRDGIAKDAAHAGAGWADTSVEHPQNAQCAFYGADAGVAAKDLHGGWFDAGDQNKYTSFASIDAIDLLRAYAGNPAIFGDDTNIPESGNGVPDILDEVKWGIDWLSRMQNSDGSMLTIVNNVGASPPSADTGPCTYGPASTSATLSAAAAFAYGSIVLGASSAVTTAYPGYAAGLAVRAANAWTWASANPSVVFQNLPAGLGGREAEVDDNGRLSKKLEAATYLFELNGTTSGAAYQTFFDANYAQLPATLDPYAMDLLDTSLEYTRAPGATPSVVGAIVSSLQAALAAFPSFTAQKANADPYMAPLQTYPWGSNGGKAGQGNMFFEAQAFTVTADAGPAIGPDDAGGEGGADATTDGGADSGPMPLGTTGYAERYVHYLHGVNPMGLVYLSNMSAHGATYSVSRLFSLWFVPDSMWAAAGASAYGPPPGFIPAGPNTAYDWDVCCPTGCGSD
ncbi:MAG TPA: glycoside hydrolase family 9 protein, partial [Polyangiaceae bacterium]|nr:glycoside hydrolase family 9 protein [Polyangiaceae bacterium]